MILSGDGKPQVTTQDGLVNGTKRWELFQQTLPGGKAALLTDAKHRPASLGDAVSWPVINASGRMIAFQGDRVRKRMPAIPWVWVMDLKTRAIRPMPGTPTPQGNFDYPEGPTFAWSPDGRFIAAAFPVPLDYGNPDVVPPPPTATLVIWDVTRRQVVPVSKNALWEAWNWVGARLAYFANDKIMTAAVHTPPDGKEMVRYEKLAFQFPPTEAVEFSPNGRQAVLVNELGGFSIIQQGSKRRHSVPYEAYGTWGDGITRIRTNFLWSPDSRYLAYSLVRERDQPFTWFYIAGVWETQKQEDETLDTWYIDLDDAEMRQVLGWSHDEQWLLLGGLAETATNPNQFADGVWLYNVVSKSKTALWQNRASVMGIAWHEGLPPSP
jgi:hypothetical protein